jgi:hypothetical protein
MILQLKAGRVLMLYFSTTFAFLFEEALAMQPCAEEKEYVHIDELIWRFPLEMFLDSTNRGGIRTTLGWVSDSTFCTKKVWLFGLSLIDRGNRSTANHLQGPNQPNAAHGLSIGFNQYSQYSSISFRLESFHDRHKITTLTVSLHAMDFVTINGGVGYSTNENVFPIVGFGFNYTADMRLWP